MATRLQQAAKTINDLAKQEHDARRQLCIAIAGAMDLVKKESNLSWREWADQNLRKPDGSKWSAWTLYTYASYGRNPHKLQHARDHINDHGKRARRALSSHPHPRGGPRATNVENEIARLIAAWEAASPAAQQYFLQFIKGKRHA
jgi:hypothetical protein